MLQAKPQFLVLVIGRVVTIFFCDFLKLIVSFPYLIMFLLPGKIKDLVENYIFESPLFPFLLLKVMKLNQLRLTINSRLSDMELIRTLNLLLK